MRYPKFLPKGGTIGFVAPSFGCNIEPYTTAFKNAQKKFTDMGYGLDLGPNCYAGCGIGISNTPEKCGQELTEYYCSDKNDVLISCGGGELMCEDLDHVDFDKIRQAQPKWYLGYSDNTNFTFLQTTLCDTASLYGPCVASFGMEPWHPAIQDSFDVLTGKKLVQNGYDKWEKESLKDEEHPLVPYNVTEPRVLRCVRADGTVLQQTDDSMKNADEEISESCDNRSAAVGTKPAEECGSPKEITENNIYMGDNIYMEGRLIGGCLDILANLVGTTYDKVPEFVDKYQEDGIVWFMEACDLNVMSIRRALWQLEHAGWFKHVKGFLFGRPLCHGEEFLGLDQYSAVTGILGKYHVPIIMDIDIGHIPPAMTLISGSYAKVRSDGQELEIQMELK